MPKKKPAVPMPEAPPVKREKINQQMMADAMRRLIGNPDFKLLQRYWAFQRIGITEGGKVGPSLEAWAELKGFEAAINAAETFAYHKTVEDLMRERQQALMQSLNGDNRK